MISEFSPLIGPIPIVCPLLQKLLLQQFISHSKRNRITRMFCRQMRNLMQQSIEINAYLIFMNLFSAPNWTDVFSMLNDGNRQSCENLKPRSWCQIRRIFLSCKTKRFRKNCKAMCNRKCRKLKIFYWAFHHVIVHFSPLCARKDMQRVLYNDIWYYLKPIENTLSSKKILIA